jgi:hypothetical protein
VTIEIHGNVSGTAFNVGEIVRDIQNHMNQIQSQGADDFRQGIKAVVESIEKDQGLSDGQKKDALESMQYISEAASEPPDKRKPAILRATFANIPNLLKAAKLAGDVWTAWEPHVKGFLGQ